MRWVDCYSALLQIQSERQARVRKRQGKGDATNKENADGAILLEQKKKGVMKNTYQPENLIFKL